MGESERPIMDDPLTILPGDRDKNERALVLSVASETGLRPNQLAVIIRAGTPWHFEKEILETLSRASQQSDAMNEYKVLDSYFQLLNVTGREPISIDDLADHLVRTARLAEENVEDVTAVYGAMKRFYSRCFKREAGMAQEELKRRMDDGETL
jgi:hypothetical protein